MRSMACSIESPTDTIDDAVAALYSHMPYSIPLYLCVCIDITEGFPSGDSVLSLKSPGDTAYITMPTQK